MEEEEEEEEAVKQKRFHRQHQESNCYVLFKFLHLFVMLVLKKVAFEDAFGLIPRHIMTNRFHL